MDTKDASIIFQLLLILVSVLNVQSQGYPCSTASNPVNVSSLGSTGYSGELWSENFPSNYTNGRTCQWNITVYNQTISSQIQISFINFRTDNSPSSADNLVIYNGPSISSPILARLNGTTLPSNILSSGKNLFLKFDTSQSVSDTGFRAMYNSDPACTSGGRMIMLGDDVTSPLHPTGYPNLENCVWNLVAAPQTNGSWTIHFNDFKLEGPHPTCTKDYVEIFEDGNKIARYCGFLAPFDVPVYGQTVRIVFRSDDSGNYPGVSFEVQS